MNHLRHNLQFDWGFRAELQMKQIEYKLAWEKLAMNNVLLVMSVAQKYASVGSEIGDLIQVCVIINNGNW